MKKIFIIIDYTNTPRISDKPPIDGLSVLKYGVQGIPSILKRYFLVEGMEVNHAEPTFGKYVFFQSDAWIEISLIQRHKRQMAVLSCLT